MGLKTIDKHYRSLMAAGLAFVIAAFCMTGCGGDVGKASEYMKKGDSAIDSFGAKIQQLKHKFQFFSISQTAEENGNSATAISALRQLLDETRAPVEEIQTLTKEAISYYKKIRQLKGVPDYVEYANLQIQAMGMGLEVLTQAIGFFNDSIEKLSNGSYSYSDYISALQRTSVDALSILTRIRKLYDDAREYRSTKKL